MDPSQVIVCLPTRNEIESVGMMIDAIQALGLEVFLSDSHSDDGTQDVAREKGVEIHQRSEKGFGPGYGAAIRNALEVAHDKGFDYLVWMDCDMTYPADRIPDLIELLPDYDMVVGARNFDDIEWSHRMANLLHTMATNMLYWSEIRDVNSGMRAVRVDKFRGHLTAKDMGLVAQSTCLSIRNGYRIIDLPVRYGKRLGESKIGIPDFFVILWAIIKERFRPKLK